MNYHTVGKEEVLRFLESSKDGLSAKQVESRTHAEYKNKLQDEKKSLLITKFFSQFTDIMVIILLIAAVISLSLAIYQKNYSDLFEGAVILFIVILNATLGVIQENKAENALESLKKTTEPYCEVIRDGKRMQIKTVDLVVGDIAVLQAGDIVPADLRMIETHNIKLDESSLTGESVPVQKDENVQLADNCSINERKNMAYSGTVVTYGRGTGVVTAIGLDTEIGKISVMIQTGKKDLTPLQKSLNKIGKIISYSVLAISVAIFFLEIFFAHQESIIDAFLTAVALAVAAIPESLPAVVTIIMALSVQKLAGRNAIIKRLHTVETLGSCQVICSDKTGTLTQNKMQVKQSFYNGSFFNENKGHNFSSNQFINLLNNMVLCNDSTFNKRVAIGDPTETALINFASMCEQNVEEILKKYERIYEVPFDSNRKLMTTVNRVDGKIISYTKGSLDSVIKNCSKILLGGKVVKLTEEHIKALTDANKKMGSKALRVLAFSYREWEEFDESEKFEEDMIFLGLVGMIDPPRPETIDAIRKCFNASLKPVMVTGDHMETAFAIAEELGIASKRSQVIVGDEINGMTQNELVEKINRYTVFARVSPEHKVRIVQAFQKRGKIVAMTGDGVNDAPSLKIADIGVGMGITGTDVTKQVADMIISDDNFATIIIAVEEGRKIYSNIQKTIQFLLSTNTVEVVTLFLACIFLPQYVFLVPSQLLFINFITDSLPAIALGLEPAEYDIMERPPRENTANILSDGVGAKILYQAAIQIVLIMIMYVLAIRFYSNIVATTMVFFTINFIQLFHSVNLKTKHSLRKINIFKNKAFNFGFIAGVAVIVLIAAVPFMTRLLGLTTLTSSQWIIVMSTSVSIIPLVEIAKFIADKIKIERVR